MLVFRICLPGKIRQASASLSKPAQEEFFFDRTQPPFAALSLKFDVWCSVMHPRDFCNTI
jgi:hypothetical protein